MRLYDLDHPPFAARVRLALRAKGIACALVPPPGGARSATYRAIVPTGLVPALHLDDGTVIPESEAIVEYLEDRFPSQPLRPTSLEARARARVLARLADLHLADPLKALFEVAKGTAPAASAEAPRAAVLAAIDAIDRTLDSGGRYAVGDRLTTADCALVPLLYFTARSAKLFPGGDPFAPHAHLAAYWRAIQADPDVAAIIADMERAQARRAAARARGEPED